MPTVTRHLVASILNGRLPRITRLPHRATVVHWQCRAEPIQPNRFPPSSETKDAAEVFKADSAHQISFRSFRKEWPRIAAPCEVRSSAGWRGYCCDKSNSFAINIAILRVASRATFLSAAEAASERKHRFHLPTVLEAVSCGTASVRKVLLIS